MEKSYGVIYLITNLINGKKYVGLTTKTLEERYQSHLWKSSNSMYPLYRAIRKHGIKNFIIEQIDTAQTKEELDIKEQYWIFELDTIIDNCRGYNMTWGGNANVIPCFETRLKMAAAAYGRVKTPKEIKKIGIASKGRNHPRSNKLWLVTNLITGETIKLFNLKSFCKEINVSYHIVRYYLIKYQNYLNETYNISPCNDKKLAKRCRILNLKDVGR